jgi:CspA family cold shock protein
MKKGTVKFFNSEKGFGFIVPEDGSEELFVHHTGLRTKRYRRKSCWIIQLTKQ